LATHNIRVYLARVVTLRFDAYGPIVVRASLVVPSPVSYLYLYAACFY